MSMFERVCAMNEAFGNPKGNPVDYEPYAVLDPNKPVEVHYNEKVWTKLEKQCSNILSEFIELYKAMGIELEVHAKTLSRDVSKRNVEDVRDALCDINVFSLGAHHFLGYDAERDMKSVIDGVLTRFCRDEDEVARTIAKYETLGVTLYRDGKFPLVCLKSTHDQQMPEYPQGKFVKSVGYSKPVFYSWRDMEPCAPATLAEPLPVHTFIKPSENRGHPHPQRRISDTLVAELGAKREQHMREQRAARMMIEEKVQTYRDQLELELYGLPPYNAKLNNTPDDKLVAPLEEVHGKVVPHQQV